MRIILLRDVPKVGRKYETKNVPDGYGRNFLIKNGLAEMATDGAMKKIQEIKKAAEIEKKIQEDLLMKNLGDINGIVITLKEKANDEGHLFAGVHKDEIISEIKKETRLDMSPEYIELDKPIKKTGEFDINVSVNGKKAKFKLIVEPY